jgi:hypothetical protein
VSIIVVWKVRDSRLAATSSTVGHGAPSHPDVAHVLLSTVDGVGLSGQATSPSGRRGLTCRPLRLVQGRGTVTSLTPRGHVWRPAFDQGRSLFPEDLSLRAEWAPLRKAAAPFRGSGEAKLLCRGQAGRNSLAGGQSWRAPSREGRGSGEAVYLRKQWAVSPCWAVRPTGRCSGPSCFVPPHVRGTRYLYPQQFM